MIELPDVSGSAWHRDAHCYGHPNPDLWFPDCGGQHAALPAKRICLGQTDEYTEPCPVLDLCRTDSLTHTHGVWAGMARKERAAYRRSLRDALGLHDFETLPPDAEAQVAALTYLHDEEGPLAA